MQKIPTETELEATHTSKTVLDNTYANSANYEPTLAIIDEAITSSPADDQQITSTDIQNLSIVSKSAIAEANPAIPEESLCLSGN